MGFEGKICGVSILRAGEVKSLTTYCAISLLITVSGDGGRFTGSVPKRPHRQDLNSEGAVCAVLSVIYTYGTLVGQDEETALPKLFYSKVPSMMTFPMSL